MFNNSEFNKAYLRIINEQFEDDGTNVSPSETDETKNDSECQLVTFKTSNKELIDALNGNVSKITVTVLDENEEENTIDFDIADITDISVLPCEDQEEVCPECGNDPCTCDQDDECDEQADEQDDECDEQDDECDEQVDDDECDECDEQDDECDEQAVDGAEWVEDGVCLKCGSSECDGTCVCPKCGDMNCIGDCDGRELSAHPEYESVEFHPRKHGRLVSEAKGCDKPKKEAKKPSKKAKK